MGATVEPLNNGHIETSHCVLYRDIVLSLEVKMYNFGPQSISFIEIFFSIVSLFRVSQTDKYCTFSPPPPPPPTHTHTHTHTAYLSPEVVLKQEMGRPLDIWSVGCVVVEMATGKLPWPEYDNQYQIMFQIGTGKSPSVATAALPDEGHEFLSHCFKSRPEERWKAWQLLHHPFVKVTSFWGPITTWCTISLSLSTDFRWNIMIT